MRIPSFAYVALLGLVTTTAALADDCSPLSVVSSVDMQLGPEGRPYVPVQINDARKAMLVDTGGFFTGITQEAADELKLSLRHSHAQFIGLSGDETSGVARASLKLGNLTADGMDLIILPGIHGLGSDDAVGVIGANLLRSYDLDLDMGGKKLNLISQKHCDGKVVYWPNNGVAVIPIRVNAVGHIFVPVQLDGHSLQAMLDTGADGSTLTLPVAQATFGITPGDNSTPMAKEPLNGKVTAYTHRFKSLSLEGIAISNPSLVLIPDMMRKMDPHDSIEGDTRIRDPNSDVGTPDVILGMDILRRLHVYIAYKEKKLYITPAAVPAATASVSANSAASASK